MVFSFHYYFGVILVAATVVNGRPEGATQLACGTTTDIAPDHDGTAPSDTPLPYSVDLSDFSGGEYIPGDTYTIRLLGSTDNPDFRGFMIQGRVLADDSPTGQFTGEPGVSKPQCTDDTAATHVDNSEKTSATLTWTAPPAGTGAIRFRFAFVDRFSLFWANIITATIEEGTPVTDPPTTTQPSTTSPPRPATTGPRTTTNAPPRPSTSTPRPTGVNNPPSPQSPPSCEDITGLPECNEKLCSSRRNRYKKCFIVKNSCTNKCQVSRCLTCEYTRQPVKQPQPQRPHCVPCKTYYDRACWHRYYTCRYNNYHKTTGRYYRTTGYHYSRYYYHNYNYYHRYERVFKCFTQCRYH